MATMQQQPEKKLIAIDVHEFVRTRDALGTAYMSLSGAIDRAVKAYIDHTNVVLAGDSSLNISYLTQPFNQVANSAQIAQLALNGANQLQVANGVAEEGGKTKRKKRAYKARDPNAPKRPLTAYFRFLQENRSKIGQEMQEKAGGATQKPGDLSKEATERWNKLDHDAQQPYRDAYQHALKDYEKEVAKHKAAGGELSKAEENMLDRVLKGEQAAVAAAEKDDEDVEVDVDDAEVDAEAAEAEEDSTDSDDDSDDDEEEEVKEPTPPPPPPPKVESPTLAKKTPKSSVKKAKPAVPPTPQFSSINPDKPIVSGSNASSSPERKRKIPATPATAEAEPAKKKRGRKTNAEKAAEAEAASAPTPSTAAVAPMVESPEAEQPKKKKKRVKAGADA